MNWNLFWGFYTLSFSLAALIVAYAVGWRGMRKGKRCTAKTIGTVIRYSAVRYNGMSLPVVQYNVNGSNYKVVGPKFKASIRKTVSVPWHSPDADIEHNLTSREDLPEVAKISVKSNGFVNIQVTPMRQLYPIGTFVDVFYDPKKPKISYVQRYAGTYPLLSFWLPLVLGIFLVGLSLYLFSYSNLLI